MQVEDETPGARRASSSADVTVVIPCFNHGEFVGEAVASALTQKGGAPAVVVVDDGSTDKSTVRALAALPDQVRVLTQPNQGPAAARNNGIRASETRLILTIDSDDRIAPGALAAQLEALDASPASGYAYGRMELFGDTNGVVRFPPFDPYILLHRPIVGSSVLMRREVFDAVGGYDVEAPGHEDWDFYLGALEHGWEGTSIDLVTHQYRKHGQSRLADDRAKYRALYRRHRRKHAALFARRPEFARNSRIGPAGRLVYRTYWAWRPLPARLEAGLYGLHFRP